MITKFTDSDNNLCCMEYFPPFGKHLDFFQVWSEEFPKVIHTFDCEEVEDLLDRGIWKRLS